MSSPSIPSSASTQTVTVTEPERVEAGQTINRILVLKLRQKQKKISWTEDTVDNEHLGRKSSKRCCIFHKKKNFGESDSDETDSEDENLTKAKREKIRNYQRFHA
jgi:protein phosphatase 1 regulatory subunit 11